MTPDATSRLRDPGRAFVVGRPLDKSPTCAQEFSLQYVGASMAFEYPSSAGTVRLAKVGRAWVVQFVGEKRGRWGSPDDAAKAVARHETGLPQWDNRREPVSQDIIDWRPLGDSI